MRLLLGGKADVLSVHLFCFNSLLVFLKVTEELKLFLSFVVEGEELLTNASLLFVQEIWEVGQWSLGLPWRQELVGFFSTCVLYSEDALAIEMLNIDSLSPK